MLGSLGFEDLRRQSAQDLDFPMNFPGCSIGGLAVGETHEEMNAVLELYCTFTS